MSEFIRRTLKILAYVSAALVILLAVMLGLFRLLLPRLPEYQDELKAWASDAIGMQVEFAGMDARWGLRGPELSFYDAELIRTATGTRAIAAAEVGIIVSLPQLLFEQALVVDTVRVNDTSVELRKGAGGAWQFQGEPLDDLIGGFSGDGREIDDITVIATDVDLLLLQPGDERPTRFEIRRLDARRDLQRTTIDADLRLPPELGTGLTVAATQRSNIVNGNRNNRGSEPWNVTVNAAGLDLAGWSALYRDPQRQVTGGQGNIDITFSLAGTNVQNVSATVRAEGMSLNAGPRFDAQGRVAWSDGDDGWLLAVDELRISTPNGAWPLTSFRAEASTEGANEVRTLDLRAAHVEFADNGIVAPWLGDRARDWLDEWRPSGAVHNLVLTITDLDNEQPGFAVAAEFDRAGIASRGDVPGIRGFSGSLRADRDGGVVAIDSKAVTLDLATWVPEAVELDLLSGTVVWRRSGTRMTILSDNILLANAVLESRSSIEVQIDNHSEGAPAPYVDLSSDWRIMDIAVAKRFIPQRVMSPNLYRWFQGALVAGSIPRGTAVLRGRLDAFPFDNGTGEFRVEADVDDVEFRYFSRFPVVNVNAATVVLDKTHLYTQDNDATTAGNASTDAVVHIRNLRQPVLTIEADANGTLASLHRFASESLIAEVLGGHLDKVTVEGPASLALDLSVPLRNAREFEFTAGITSTAGTLRIAGLEAPLTELAGTVIVEREHIEGDGVTGRFLGSPLEVDVRDAGPASPGYRVIAEARGAATAEALVGELGLPLADVLDGKTSFAAEVRFPRAGHQPPAPFAVQVDSDLAGIAVRLPAPFAKDATQGRPFSSRLEFAPGGEFIVVTGSAGDAVDWDLRFARLDDAWDFDRGMLTLGGVPRIDPDVRGLHIRGTIDELRIADWLQLGQGEGLEAGAGERIRSVDLQVGALTFIGQRLLDHRLQVDRSARDWLVQLEGDDVAGSIFVPYDFSAASKLVLDMERLILPGDGDPNAGDPERPATRLDPRDLPAISLRTGSFGLGERRFGRVVADFVHDGSGLVADPIVATDPTFRIEGRARWGADPANALGSRSDMVVTLTSSDVEQTMERLGYQPGIESEDMRIDLDMHWSGGPYGNFLRTLDGQVEVAFGNGQLNEVEPGAGRVFGLMSIAALPRRLALDFRDVFQKGFVFDEISGTFRLDNGSAYTCDLTLASPAADIGVTGRTDLVAGSYSQAAVVSANLGNTLPVVGAIAAGPQVAAALFLFSQIFKKPLREVGQVYYSMTGPWDSPEVESTDAEAFARMASQAGCLADAQTD